MKNLLTDIAGIRVGHADDQTIASGATAILFDQPAVAAMDIRGGGPGTRESALLELGNTVDHIDALALSGGSAFGLDTGSGIQAWLAEQGRGFDVGGALIPIVPGAIMFDMLNGGNKKWGRFSPYRELGFRAAENASDSFTLGSVGAGLGATTVNFKGGVGSASAQLANGIKVAALTVVNAMGSVTMGDGPWFWAAAFEENNEFGGRGWPEKVTPEMLAIRLKGAPDLNPLQNTTLAVVATDAILTKPQAKRLAMMAHTGFARAIYPVHAPLDGDIIFSVATGEKEVEPYYGLSDLGAIAANVVARAMARGVYEAAALNLPDTLPAWKQRFG